MEQVVSKSKDDVQVVFLLSCFVGHPVSNIDVNVATLIGLNYHEDQLKESLPAELD